MGNSLASRRSGQRAARNGRKHGVVAELWRLSQSKRRERVIPEPVLKKLAAMQMPPRKRDYNRALKLLLCEYEQRQGV